MVKFIDRAFSSTSKFFLTLTLAVVAVFIPAHSASAVLNPQTGPTAGGTTVTVNGLTFIQVESGEEFSLGLTNSGTVYSWGVNISGQLGVGTTNSSLVPIQVKDSSGTGYLSGVTSIAAGYNNSFAITATGLYAWGANTDGKLGDGTTAARLLPVKVKDSLGTGFLTGVTSVAADGNHTAAITNSGLFAWGDNFAGQLGNGTTTRSFLPVQVKDSTGSGFLSGVTQIATGAAHTLALTPQGLYAFGWNNFGQLGNGSNTNASLPTFVRNTSDTANLTGVTNINTSGFDSMALTPSGLLGWGANIDGQLGNNSGASRNLPTHVLNPLGTAPLEGVTSFSLGLYSAYAITTNGVFAWGDNSQGQLGDNSTSRRLLPVEVKDTSGTGVLTSIDQISGGGSQVLAISGNGVLAWGYNVSGQLGNGSSTNSLIPTLSANFQPVSVTFGGIAGTDLSASGSQWTVTTPAGVLGSVDVLGRANLFGGMTPGDPSAATWEIGSFSYANPAPAPTPEPTLAATGTPAIFAVTSIALLSVLMGTSLFVAFSRKARD